MKKLNKIPVAILFLLTAFFTQDSFSQTAQWIRQQGTTGITNGVSHDAIQNCYAAGQVNDPALFDNLTQPAHFADIFLAKYNSEGILQWAKTAGGNLIDVASDVVTDANGNSYVAGTIQTNSINPTVTFNNTILNGHGSFDWFLAKYDANGNLLWVHVEGGTQGDFAFGIDQDPAGNILIAGEFIGSMTVSGLTITSAGLSDIFIAKYSPAGTLTWLKRAGGTGADEVQSLATDANGNFAVCGNFQNTVNFGAGSITASGLGDAFIAKYNGSGNNLWAKKGGGNVSFSTDKANSITCDAFNNFYITGEYSGVAAFDNLTVTNTGSSGTDIFIAKYNSNGVIQWLHHGGGNHDDKGFGIDAGGSDDIFVTGFADSGPGVVFDNIALPPLGNEYIFLAKYNSSGSVSYVKQYAAGIGEDIDAFGDGCLYFGGHASKSNSGNEFDTIDLVYVDRDGFAGKFCDQALTCFAPEDFVVNKITATSAKINWTAIPGAISYTIQYRKQGMTNWKTKSSATASKKIANLQPSTTYEYHVATVCSGGASSYSAIHTFITLPMRSGELIEEAAINIYPNPAQGHFTLHLQGLSEYCTISVFDLSGKIIFEQKVSGIEDTEINVPSSLHGLAYVVVSDGIHLISKTVVIE